MQRFHWLQIICFFNILSLLITIIYINRDSTNNFLFPLIRNDTIFDLMNTSFQDERINQLLESHSFMYEHSSNECNKTVPLADDAKNALEIMSIKLLTLRLQIIPYPNEYFQGRGIVLTTGRGQVRYAEVNLKMIQRTGTQLPVQVTYVSIKSFFFC